MDARRKAKHDEATPVDMAKAGYRPENLFFVINSVEPEPYFLIPASSFVILGLEPSIQADG